jgi:serine/threonine protein kinase
MNAPSDLAAWRARGAGAGGSVADEGPATQAASMEASGARSAQAVREVPAGSEGGLVAGRYRLQALLGRGGMGEVWRAEDELLHRPVAVKHVVVRGDARRDPPAAARARALGEARAAARIGHVGTVAEVARIGLCLLDALQVVHRAGMVHRDVTPANVYLCADGRVVLTDFGIAWAADGGSEFPRGEFVGSPAYVPPELVNGGTLGPAADLFSLGATLYAGVEGRAAFDKGSVFATVAAVLAHPPAPFRRAGPLRPVIEGLLAKEPQHRPTAEAATAALRAIHPSPWPPPQPQAMPSSA